MEQNKIFDCYDENLKIVLFNDSNLCFSEIIKTESKN